MMNQRVAALAVVGLVLGAGPLAGQELSRYRDYSLGSSVAATIALSGARADATKTLHERPALIQESEWRAPYVSPGAALADPVRDMLFSFYDDQLYRVVVTYEADRMEGLTDDDVIESISARYGAPLLRHSARVGALAPAGTRPAMAILAQWEDASAALTLTRGTYLEQFQLVLISKRLDAEARAAALDAVSRDAAEAPGRERDRRAKDVADARVASQKARLVNKAAFKP